MVGVPVANGDELIDASKGRVLQTRVRRDAHVPADLGIRNAEVGEHQHVGLFVGRNSNRRDSEAHREKRVVEQRDVVDHGGQVAPDTDLRHVKEQERTFREPCGADVRSWRNVDAHRPRRRRDHDELLGEQVDHVPPQAHAHDIAAAQHAEHRGKDHVLQQDSKVSADRKILQPGRPLHQRAVGAHAVRADARVEVAQEQPVNHQSVPVGVDQRRVDIADQPVEIGVAAPQDRRVWHYDPLAGRERDLALNHDDAVLRQRAHAGDGRRKVIR